MYSRTGALGGVSHLDKIGATGGVGGALPLTAGFDIANLNAGMVESEDVVDALQDHEAEHDPIDPHAESTHHDHHIPDPESHLQPPHSVTKRKKAINDPLQIKLILQAIADYCIKHKKFPPNSELGQIADHAYNRAKVLEPRKKHADRKSVQQIIELVKNKRAAIKRFRRSEDGRRKELPDGLRELEEHVSIIYKFRDQADHSDSEDERESDILNGLHRGLKRKRTSGGRLDLTPGLAASLEERMDRFLEEQQALNNSLIQLQQAEHMEQQKYYDEMRKFMSDTARREEEMLDLLRTLVTQYAEDDGEGGRRR